MTPKQKKSYNRQYYVLRNAHRLGKPRGPKSGVVYGRSQAEDEEAVEAFRQERLDDLSRLVRESSSLPRTCEFCARYGYQHDLTVQFCEAGLDTRPSGTCEQWEPRYRCGDEEEDLPQRDTEDTENLEMGKGRAA